MTIEFLLVVVCIAFVVLVTKLSAIDKKLTLLTQLTHTLEVDWSKHFNEEVHTNIMAGNLAKAATILSKQTDLPHSQCLDIVQQHANSVAAPST